MKRLAPILLTIVGAIVVVVTILRWPPSAEEYAAKIAGMAGNLLGRTVSPDPYSAAVQAASDPTWAILWLIAGSLSLLLGITLLLIRSARKPHTRFA